ncbi:3-keto-5-aminohexanoate cleavage protein [Bradyrhizobium sp.]|uniref:3-keto-5-aminohexanoate cleavage protein n=1 Tax=Bradyrhizobium sp. TaxID=376 RepID=UPI001E14B969|nr:3-keto-5-aminohexanoate cleavage protein [Bradyrhizobium sp.]MBI5318850.1 3-keto-5-aminohexanoate cleavage protein [Bradyrhizobium sp.]
MLQACLNGGRKRDFHPALPLSADELAADARAVIAAGAEQIHLHVRSADGRESLHPDDVAPTLAAVRAAVPGVPLGLSTGWWIPPRGRARQDQIRAWRALPDYVSINLIEEDSTEVIELALAKGIGVEAGIWSPADAEKFVADRNAGRCLRVLIEINEQDLAVGMEACRGITAILDRAGIRLPRLLHGLDATMWDFYRAALTSGLDGRIGLEDGKHLPTGAVAEDNAALIRAARTLAA